MLKKSASGRKPTFFSLVSFLFSSVFFCFLCVLEVVTSVANAPYPFYFVFVPRIASFERKCKLMFCCPDFCASPKISYLSARVREIYEKIWAPAPGCYLTFIVWIFFDLSHVSASNFFYLYSQFCFDRFLPLFAFAS